MKWLRIGWAGSCIWGEGSFNFDMILALAATAEAMHITEDTQRRAGASRRRSASSLPLRPTRIHGVGEAEKSPEIVFAALPSDSVFGRADSCISLGLQNGCGTAEGCITFFQRRVR